MIAFRVTLNGKHLATAGLPGKHVLSAILTSVVRTDRALARARGKRRRLARRQLDFDLGGLVSREDGGGEFVDWARRDLHVGDSLVLEVVEVTRADEPSGRRPLVPRQSRSRRGRRAGHPTRAGRP